MNMYRSLAAVCVTLAIQSPIALAAPLASTGHIHGLSFGGERQQTLMLGAHHGLYSYEHNNAQRVSETSFDVMGLAKGAKPGVLYASGHPQQGGNSGLLRSVDGGKSFKLVSTGLDGPVDFHQLTISPVDPQRIYGFHSGLQVSSDGGKSWNKRTVVPEKLLKLAASGLKTDRLYAASEQGFFLSEDAGETWQRLLANPTTTVIVHKSAVYAFVVGQGLLKATEADLQWKEVDNRFGAQVLLDLAISGDDQRLVGLNQYGSLLESQDQGRNWQALPAKPQPVSATEKRGQQLFQRHCQSCHGIEAVGETYSIEGLTTPNFLFAPALNGSMHGWHHTDEQLVKTILEGSPRTDKMPAWKGTLNEADALAVIAYLKTLWGETQKRCQGPGHMDRACLAGQ